MNTEDLNRIFCYLLDCINELDEKIEKLESKVKTLELNDPPFDD